MIDLDGQSIYVERPEDLPPLFREVADAWREALEEGRELQRHAGCDARPRRAQAQGAVEPARADLGRPQLLRLRRHVRAFASRSFRHREVFGQVGFGTGGWDTDFPNSMLEILRVVVTNCDEEQRLVVGGVEQLPRRLWRRAAERMAHWPQGTTLETACTPARPGPASRRSRPPATGRFAITDRWGDTRDYPAVLVTCQSWLLTTHIATDESLFSHSSGWRSTVPATCSRPRPS